MSKNNFQCILDILLSMGIDYSAITDEYKCSINIDVDEETLGRSHRGKNRGNLPRHTSPEDFSIVIEGIFEGTQERYKSFAFTLYQKLKESNSFPQSWIEHEERINGFSDSFDNEIFKSFIISLLMSDKEAKKNKKIGIRSIESVSIESNNDEYYNQNIYNSINKKSFFDIANADFSQLKKERLVLIEGEGGQGKSTFLKKLNELKQKQSDFKNIIVISLARFVDFLNKSDIQPLANKCTYIVSYILNNNLSSKDIKSVFCKNGEPTLLLLDGFNEAYAFSDTTSRNAVIDELEEIKNKYANICFVVTTRPSEGSYSFKKCDFLKDFSIYYLSGVSDEMYQEFISKHNDLPKEILEIARIPLYFKALNKSNNLSNIRNKNDLLKEIYYQNYKQASLKPGSDNSYFAYYLLAPAVADYMSRNGESSIESSQIKTIAHELFDECNFLIPLLHAIAAKECFSSGLPYKYDVDAIYNAFINNGPLKSECGEFSNTYSFFHEEIRKYLLAYNSWMHLIAIKTALLKDQYPYTSKVSPNLNLESDAVYLLKIRLGLVGKNEDIANHILDFFKTIDSVSASLTWQIVFYHIAYLFSEYLSLGKEFLDTYHTVLQPISNRIIDIIEHSQYDQFFFYATEAEKTDAKMYVLDILCKECEYFRRNSLFDCGEKCIEIARKISNCDYSVINQHAKISLAKFETSCLSGESVDQQSFDVGMKELKSVSENGFILSANLLSLIYSAPNPILTYANKHINVDNVESFYILYSAIQQSINDKLYAHEIDYSIRQAVALLLKGYVRLRPEIKFYEKMILSKRDFCPGDFDTFSIDNETIKLAKYLLKFADGLYRPSLDYFRAIIKWYESEYVRKENNVTAAKALLNESEALLTNENRFILNQIVLNYKFGKDYDIDASIKKALNDPENNGLSLDNCHSIYWALIDPMHLELSLNPGRKKFYDKMIEELDDTCKKTVKLLNL